MFSLLYGLWQYVFTKEEYFVLIVGLDNSGKTTFLEQTKIKFNPKYKGINLKRITTTVGLNLGSVDASGVRVHFWDLGGQREIRNLWDKYYSECHGLIYIVDAADLERMEESREMFEKMMKNDALRGVPLLLVANKQDVDEALSLKRIKDIFASSLELIGRRDIHAVEASAITGDGINDSISWIISSMKRNSGIRPPRSPTD